MLLTFNTRKYAESIYTEKNTIFIGNETKLFSPKYLKYETMIISYIIQINIMFIYFNTFYMYM